MIGGPVSLAGLRVGHATDQEGRTGCTVLLGPFRGAAFVAGHATGTRELDPVSSLHLVPLIDALLLTGGSTFGLSAAEGVVSWLEERGIGFDTMVARVPIVPAAVIFDLGVGRADRRPNAAMGRQACENASADPPAEGQVGVGTGATAGKVMGRELSVPGGFGCASATFDGSTLMAMAVANPLGDVIGFNGEIVAGARAADGSWVNTHGVDWEASMRQRMSRASPPGTNTTLAAIVTDAPLPRDALAMVARMAAAALARRIDPAFTPFDGDVVFALSTTAEPRAVEPGHILAFGATATTALEHAIVRAVSPAERAKTVATGSAPSVAG